MSDSNLASVAFQRETDFGTPAVPVALKLLRLTKENLQHEKMVEVSQEVRPDRQTTESIEVGVEAKGSVDFEFSIGDFDSFLESALCSAFADVSGTDTLTNGVERTSFILEKKITETAFFGYTGMNVDGFSLNLQSRKIVTGSMSFLGLRGTTSAISIGGYQSGTLTFTGNAVADETVVFGGKTYTWKASATTTANEVTIGATAADSRNNLIAAANLGTGSGSLYGSATTLNPLKASAGTTGTKMVVVERAQSNSSDTTTETMTNASWAAATLGGGTYEAAGTGLILSASVNVGALEIDGSPTASLRSLTINVANNLRANDVIGQKEMEEVGMGEFGVSGSLTAYFRNRTLLDNFVDHEYVSLSFELTRNPESPTDGDLVGYRFTLPKVIFTKGSVDIPGKNTDITLPLDYMAHVGVDGYTMKIEKLVYGTPEPAGGDRFAGVDSNGTLTDVEVLALEITDQESGVEMDFTVTPSSEHIVIAIPAEEGEITSIIANGLESISDFNAPVTLSVGGVVYNVLVSTYALTGTYVISTE